MARKDRLISANVLFDELVKRQYSEQSMGIIYSYYPQMREIVCQQPTVDAVEVVHGRWIRRGNEMKCSKCKFIYYSNHDDFNYCPNCGAKMDGGKANEM